MTKYTVTKPIPPTQPGAVLARGCNVWQFCELSGAYWLNYGTDHVVSVEEVAGKWWRRSLGKRFGPFDSAISAQLGLTAAEVPSVPSDLEQIARGRNLAPEMMP